MYEWMDQTHTGSIQAPRQILHGGYLSWHNLVDDHWYQLTWFTGDQPAVRDLGIQQESSKSMREIIGGLAACEGKCRHASVGTRVLG